VRMTGWVAALLAGLAIAGLAGDAATGGQTPLPTVKTFIQLLDTARVQAMTQGQLATIAHQNEVIVLNSWQFRLIPVLKRANPAVQAWVYKNLSGVRSDDCTTRDGNCGACPAGVMDSGFLSSGMGYCWLKRNHPDWLLHAAGSGQPFEFRGYPHIWETDYGNRAYQRQWIRNVLADVRDHGWDGVELDNALTTADAYGTAAKYPTDTAVQAASYSALRAAGHALRQAGVRSVANVGYATRFPQLWQRWLGPVDGLLQEFYLSSTTQPDAVGDGWDLYENEVSTCAAMHKVCWFHSGTYASAVTPRTRAYALASFLLATDGRQLLSVGDFTSVPLAPRWTMGASLSAMDGMRGSWRRYFAGGVAVVNPTGSSTVADLGGNYLSNAGRPVSAVSLPPASGTVLRAVTGAGASPGGP
jgi:hypothetical protein